MNNHHLKMLALYGLVILFSLTNCHKENLNTMTEENFPPIIEEVITEDNTLPIECYSSNHCLYKNAKPVALILRDGIHPGTGFLIGPSGYFITAKHVIRDSTDLERVTFEFMARCDCDKPNSRSPGECRGKVIEVKPEWVVGNEDLDYTLLKFPKSITDEYGFLSLRREKLMPRENIYIHQYQLGGGLRTSFEILINDSIPTSPIILGVEVPVCESNSLNGFEHNAETKNGSSGAPIISADDHLVIGLHQCQHNGVNQGITIDAIIGDLTEKGLLPNDVVTSNDNSRAFCNNYNKIGVGSSGLLEEKLELKTVNNSGNMSGLGVSQGN